MASWPKIRISAWNALLKARAIENISYTIGVNRVGFDGNNYEYTGNSILFNYMGDSLSEENYEKENIILITIDKAEQQKARNKFRFLEDKDLFEIKK